MVVVLIIGILSAVALPQYQVAVLKTRMTTVLPLMCAVKEANERYYLANGEYTDDLAALDIAAPGGATGDSARGMMYFPNSLFVDNIGGTGTPDVVGGLIDDNGSCLWRMFFDHSDAPGKITCGEWMPNYGASTHPKCAQICKSMGY